MYLPPPSQAVSIPLSATAYVPTGVTTEADAVRTHANTQLIGALLAEAMGTHSP